MKAVLNLSSETGLCMVDKGDGLYFIRDTDISVMYLDVKQKDKLFQYLYNDYKNRNPKEIDFYENLGD